MNALQGSTTKDRHQSQMNPRKRRSLQIEVAPKQEQKPSDQRIFHDLSKKLDSLHFTRNPDETQLKRTIVPDPSYIDENAFWKAQYEEECKKTELLGQKKEEWKLFIKTFNEIREEGKDKD
jgi:hypothetical protein